MQELGMTLLDGTMGMTERPGGKAGRTELVKADFIGSVNCGRWAGAGSGGGAGGGGGGGCVSSEKI